MTEVQMARHGVHAYNPSTREVEVGRLGVQDQLQLRRLSYFSPILLNSLILLSFFYLVFTYFVLRVKLKASKMWCTTSLMPSAPLNAFKMSVCVCVGGVDVLYVTNVGIR